MVSQSFRVCFRVVLWAPRELVSARTTHGSHSVKLVLVLRSLLPRCYRSVECRKPLPAPGCGASMKLARPSQRAQR